jgi:hypothetical protein
MKALRCEGLGCRVLSDELLARYADRLAAGRCVCRVALLWADRCQRRRAVGQVGDRRVMTAPPLPPHRPPPRRRADSGAVGGGSVKGASEPLTEYPKVPR